jgi:hypothetical protein
MAIRGRNPSWITCCVTEKAPEITACDAITVASVARMTIAVWAACPPGTRKKNGFDAVSGREMRSAPCPR